MTTQTNRLRRVRAPSRSGRWWDERHPGGRLRSLLFLTHPGPSLLVTGTFVAVAALAGRSAPSPARVAQLVFVMLPIQFAIGITNDVFDRRDDAAGKPYKPLVRGVVSRRVATEAAVILALTGLAVASTVNALTFGLSAGGLAAGLAYDAGLRRTPLSWVPWWAGISLLPLAAFASVGRFGGRLGVVIPLAGLIAIALHLANAAPDIAADRAGGRRTLPVVLGSVWSRRLAIAGLAAVTAAAVVLAVPLGQNLGAVGGAAGLVAAVLVVLAVLRPARPFPPLAVATAVLAITWLAALPV